MATTSIYEESLRAFLKPVLSYLDDQAVSEIMINGPRDVWIEKKGKVSKTDATFTEEGLLGAARNMAQFVGRPLGGEHPALDARLPDGSRIHVLLPPIARNGTTISIRKFFKDKLTIGKLVEFGSMTTAMARFIEGCVRIKENIVVAGGTGSGKTTLLNVVSSLIPNDERILTIEDSAELQLNQAHVVAFESRPPDQYGKGEFNMGNLLHSALRLRPDRIVVGAVRGGEAFDLMQAMNTGHGGSMSTTHANTPTDTLRRLESLCLMSGVELPMVAVRAQVASAVNVVITCERLADGSRKTTAIAEVLPLNDRGDYRTQDIFVFTPTHRDEEGKVHGYHAPTGVIPNFIGRLHAYGFTDMTEDFFDPGTYGMPPPPVFTADQAGQTHWIKKLKHRESGQADSEEQSQQWADARLAKGRESEREAREAAAKRVAGEAMRKGVEAVPPTPTPATSAAPTPPEAAPRVPPPHYTLPRATHPSPQLRPEQDAGIAKAETLIRAAGPPREADSQSEALAGEASGLEGSQTILFAPSHAALYRASLRRPGPSKPKVWSMVRNREDQPADRDPESNAPVKPGSRH